MIPRLTLRFRSHIVYMCITVYIYIYAHIFLNNATSGINSVVFSVRIYEGKETAFLSSASLL